MAKFNFESLEESGEATVEEEVVVEKQEEEEEVSPESTEEVEPDNQSDEEEEVVVDEEVEVEEPTPKKVEKTPYTEAEIAEILKNDEDIDTSRLSPAEQATMKAMQRGFTPKLQEAAELKREVEELRKKIEDKAPQEQPADIYEAYDKDPEGVLKYVDDQVNTLVATGTPEALIEARQLESLKFDFNRRELEQIKKQHTNQRAENQYISDILRVVPDLATKQVELRDFALSELGYTAEELAFETDPAQAGRSAVRAIERINTAYDKAKAKVSVKQKRVKKATKVEKPSETSQGKPDVDELQKIKRKALETGDFKDFFTQLEED